MESPKIPEPDEAELRAGTTQMYRQGGIENVLNCVLTMQKCQVIIMKKLNELLEEENKK